MNLSTKLTILLSGLILLIGSISYYGIFSFQSEILKKEITEKLQYVAALYLDNLDRMLDEELNDLKAISINPVIKSRKSTPAQIQREIEKFLNQYPQYIAVSFFDMDRIKIATAGQGDKDIGEQHLWNEYWPAVYAHKDLIVDYSMSASLKKPTIHLVNPIKDDQGVPFGVIVLRTQAVDTIEKIIREYESINNNIPKYNMDILDKDGIVLYSNYKKTAVFTEIDEDFAYIRNILPLVKKVGSLIIEDVQEDVQGRETERQKGEEILVFAKEQGYRKFKGNDWILKIELPVSEAFSSVNHLGKKTAVFLVGITLFTVAAIIAILLIIVIRPLKKLSEATVRLSKGDFGTKVTVESGDEIGKLAESFNELSALLKTSEAQSRSLAHHEKES